MSRPLRLVPQTAQAFEFSCPLCGSEHAAYGFGTTRFRVFRCAGCALTFSKKALQSTSPTEHNLATSSRTAQDHGTLLAALDALGIKGPLLLVAAAEDDLIGLLQRRGLSVGKVVDENGFGIANWGGTYYGAIISSALMRVPDPRAALLKIRRHLPSGVPLLLSVPLLDGAQARLMGRGWHEWHASNLWYFTRE